MIYHRTLLADLLTPVSAFLRVAGRSSRAFLLESVEGGEKIGRYSFIGLDPERDYEGSFQGFREIFPPSRPSHPELPPFTGGAVGIFSYDLARELEHLPPPAAWRSALLPGVMVDFYSTVLAFDHLHHRILVMSHRDQHTVEQLAERLLTPAPEEERRAWWVEEERSPGSRELVAEGWGEKDSQFREAVLQAKEFIRAGDIFQVVLSQRFQRPFQGEPFDVYRALRYLNPSPYLFFLKRDGLAVAGSSPEMLVRVQGEELFYRPIAGTRRRGKTPEEERELEEELFSDEKERAEHLMLVDLGRNDLGRVCRFGSVQVENFMYLEKYSHVMHLVSSLRGRLAEGKDRFDALAACFPAGTVTGAPKVRAMQIIDQLEPCPRGVYGGAIGYLDYSGNLDTCIAIRTIVMEKGVAILQAGAGIVADSRPELEDKECHNKARVLVRALEMAERMGEER